MSEKIIIFDTTLRDGEQAPGATMSLEEKIAIAKLLELMGVDVIEAGFPIASEGDFQAVSKIAKIVKNSSICALARAIPQDIEAAGNAVKDAVNGRIHTFISTSDIHLKYQIKKTKDEVLQYIKDSVSLARKFTDNIEWSAMDATRSNKEFLLKAIEIAIDNGAKTVNVPDTVGYTVPDEYYQLISDIKNKVPNIDKAIISVHCHNDLGLAVANSLSSLKAGARQIECTINGIGERAGNAALEEVVMSLKTRKDFYDFHSDINSKMISRASHLVSNVTGFPVQFNKAIIGKNAFAHESGIHQDGMLKNRNTYEIITPESIGLSNSNLPMGKHSGRSAFQNKIKEFGYELNKEDLDAAFFEFKKLCDRKKHVVDDDVISVIDKSISSKNAKIELVDLEVSCKKNNLSKVTIKIKIDKEEIVNSFESRNGPVATIFEAIKGIIPHEAILDLYQVNSVTEGIDAQATVNVRLKKDGVITSSLGVSTSVLNASAIAYLNCLERLLAKK